MIWGLSYLDVAIIIGFLLVVLGVGVAASRGVKHQSDFLLSGRKMGKALQFFLNFGNATDSAGAPQMASQIHREGAGGMWLSLQTLFITPFFWFTQPWFRRARVTTMADLFVDRFNSKAVAACYAAFSIVMSLIALGLGNLTSYQVVSAMTPKPIGMYSATELQEHKNLEEFNQLLKEKAAATLPAEKQQHFNELEALSKDGKLRSRIPLLTPISFYLGYTIIVAIYIMLGGLKAAAVTDSIQSILIILMSIILIPLGLSRIGGFSGLHQLVEPPRFFLTGGVGEFTWYTIVLVTIGSMVQIFGLQHNMASGGSAKDENTARFGMIAGGFTKRIVLICWMFCGLLSLAVLSGDKAITNHDLAWGALSRELLPMGLMGVMLAGMLLGHMPMVGLAAVAVAGLVTRNIYQPLVPGKSDRHYMRVSQATIAIVLFASIGIAISGDNITNLLKNYITWGIFFGAVVFMLFFWRRLTAGAILISFAIFVITVILIPQSAPTINAMSQNTNLHLKTNVVKAKVYKPATPDDVKNGIAMNEGELILKDGESGGLPLFWDRIGPADAKNPLGAQSGKVRFSTENYLAYQLGRTVGLDLRNARQADLNAIRWLVDTLLPFLCLVIFSYLTPQVEANRADRFYAKMKTPVAPTPGLDQQEIEKNVADPHRFDHQKLFPKTNWEFCKWTTNDYKGFFGCWAIVIAILGLLWTVLHLGTPWPWY